MWGPKMCAVRNLRRGRQKERKKEREREREKKFKRKNEKVAIAVITYQAFEFFKRNVGYFFGSQNSTHNHPKKFFKKIWVLNI